jgi:transcription elongation factor GreB
MSKAFTRESDDLPERSGRERQSSGLPPGAKNYMTADGAQRLRAELDRLVLEERPRAARLADKDAAAREVAHVNQRIAEVQTLLRSATIAPPPTEPLEEVCFGAVAELRDARGGMFRVRIVGNDETGADESWVSWLSPLGRALLGSRRGQRVSLPSDDGWREVEVVGIARWNDPQQTR